MDITAPARGRLVVVAGPAGVGKSTVVGRLRQLHPELFFSVSMTTRDPRPGERNGRDYFFVSRAEFDEAIANGEMLEWADIHGGLQRSGTPAKPVLAALETGEPVLLEVDIVGADSVRAALPEAHLVFIAPPSWEVLVDRLVGRGTETPEVIERRLETARNELAAQDRFDEIVVNRVVDDTVAQLAGILYGL